MFREGPEDGRRVLNPVWSRRPVPVDRGHGGKGKTRRVVPGLLGVHLEHDPRQEGTVTSFHLLRRYRAGTLDAYLLSGTKTRRDLRQDPRVLVSGSTKGT